MADVRLPFLAVVLTVMCMLPLSESSAQVRPIGAPLPPSSMLLVESIPVELDLTTSLTTYDSWINLLQGARETIDILCFYMTLTEGSEYPPYVGGGMGIAVYEAIKSAAARGVKIRIIQNEPDEGYPETDTAALAAAGLAEVRNISFPRLGYSGIQHAKSIIVDSSSFYLGSANMDWRALSQVKELGLVSNQPDIAADTQRMFDIVWQACIDAKLPPHWPANLDTLYNIQHPAKVAVNGQLTSMFISASPPGFCSDHRTQDIDALLHIIDTATSKVCVEVMDYIPASLYFSPNTYWPTIDDAFRRAAYRGVELQILIGKWNHTVTSCIPYLKSLDELDHIEVRWFLVPDMKLAVDPPYTRVNHAKFMVSETNGFVSTSNWSEDYFTTTGGLSLNIGSGYVRDTLQHAFDRDWNSEHSVPVM